MTKDYVLTREMIQTAADEAGGANSLAQISGVTGITINRLLRDDSRRTQPDVARRLLESCEKVIKYEPLLRRLSKGVPIAIYNIGQANPGESLEAIRRAKALLPQLKTIEESLYLALATIEEARTFLESLPDVDN